MVLRTYSGRDGTIPNDQRVHKKSHSNSKNITRNVRICLFGIVGQ